MAGNVWEWTQDDWLGDPVSYSFKLILSGSVTLYMSFMQ